jgi:NAD(P)H dehydrogenase (quinone)
VPPGYADPVQFAAGNPYGASHVSNNATLPPGEVELASIGFQARRLTESAARWKRGEKSGSLRTLPTT